MLSRNQVNAVVFALNLAFVVWVWWKCTSNSKPDDNVKTDIEHCKNPAWDFNWDGRHPVRANRESNELAQHWKYIFLIRHGHYFKANALNPTDPRIGHLSPLGEQQVDLVGKRLKNLNITFHRFVTSTSPRASETARVIQSYLPHAKLERDDLLREGWPNFPNPAHQGWNPEDPVFHVDRKRLDKAFAEYFHRAQLSEHMDSNELIVAHGNVIAYFVLRALQLPQERWLKVAVQQASITMLVVFPDGNVDLRILGDVGHLAQHQWTVQ